MTELTAGEQAYLDSGGTDSAGLIAENPTPEKIETPVEHKIEPDKPAPAAAEKPADAPAATEPPEPGEEEIPTTDGKSKRRMVDSRALKAEREKARAFEAELKAERETRARIDERLKMLSEAVSSAEPTEKVDAAPEVPDIEVDIFGNVREAWNEIKAIKASLAGHQAETAEQRQTAAVISSYQRDAVNFESKQPDFKEAYNFLIGLRKTQLEAQRYSPEEVNKWLHIEEMNLVQRAFEGKTSPSQDIYNLAKSMGYAPKAAAAAAQPTAQPAPAAPAKPAPAAPLTAPSVTEEIDRIKAGKAASISLSNGGGGGAEEMSLEWLANAPLKEFQAFMDKPGNREKVERAMGKAA